MQLGKLHHCRGLRWQRTVFSQSINSIGQDSNGHGIPFKMSRHTCSIFFNKSPFFWLWSFSLKAIWLSVMSHTNRSVDPEASVAAGWFFFSGLAHTARVLLYPWSRPHRSQVDGAEDEQTVCGAVQGCKGRTGTDSRSSTLAQQAIEAVSKVCLALNKRHKTWISE